MKNHKFYMYGYKKILGFHFLFFLMGDQCVPELYLYIFHKCYGSVYAPSRLTTWKGEIKELILCCSLHSPTCAVVTYFVTSLQLLNSPCLVRTCYAVHLLEAEDQRVCFIEDYTVWIDMITCMLHFLVWAVSIVVLLLLCFACCDWGRYAAAMSDHLDDANNDMHDMCTACSAHEGKKICTREDNCIACSSWDDLTWDAYEAKLAKKERIRERKQQKVAERSASVLSEDSANMFPDSAEEGSFNETGECDVKSVVKKVSRRSPAP